MTLAKAQGTKNKANKHPPAKTFAVMKLLPLLNASYKNELFIFTTDFNLAAFLDMPRKQFFRHGIFQKPLDRPFKRSGPVNGIKTFFDQKLHGVFGKLHINVSILQALDHIGDLQLNDIMKVLLSERFKDNNIIDEVQELGFERFFDLFQKTQLHILIRDVLFGGDKSQ